MSNMKIVVCSLWRNDAGRNLLKRAGHLLDKTAAGRVTWLWAIGDSDDRTELRLRHLAADESCYNTIRVMNVDTGVVGEDAPTRRIRSSRSATAMFAHPDVASADYVLLHESDLISPVDVIDRLLIAGDSNPCAGWPTIDIGHGPQFYDTWAYIDTTGRNFDAHAQRPSVPFRVHGFGSVWIAPARRVAGRVLREHAIRELCAAWRREGVPMWVDPNTEIIQPRELWEPA